MNPRKSPPIVAVLGVLAFAASSPAIPSESVRAFDITASRFEFQPDRIEVTEGDQVKLTLRSADTKHGIAIAELKVKVKIPKGGTPVTAEFVASKPGTFVIKCSEYCGPGHKQMMATLVVTPRERQ